MGRVQTVEGHGEMSTRVLGLNRLTAAEVELDPMFLSIHS